jgi:hypothetical protein
MPFRRELPKIDGGQQIVTPPAGKEDRQSQQATKMFGNSRRNEKLSLTLPENWLDNHPLGAELIEQECQWQSYVHLAGSKSSRRRLAKRIASRSRRQRCSATRGGTAFCCRTSLSPAATGDPLCQPAA